VYEKIQANKQLGLIFFQAGITKHKCNFVKLYAYGSSSSSALEAQHLDSATQFTSSGPLPSPTL